MIMSVTLTAVTAAGTAVFRLGLVELLVSDRNAGAIAQRTVDGGQELANPPVSNEKYQFRRMRYVNLAKEKKTPYH